MDSKEKIIELAKKVNALAKGGVDGEASAAQEKLRQIMEKYGIKEEDINDHEDVRDFTFRLRGDIKKKMLMQVISHLYDISEIKGTMRITGDSYTFIMQMTPTEFLTIQSMFQFYWNAYQEEQLTHYYAFVQAQKIFSKGGGKGSANSRMDPDQLMRILQMSKGIEQKTFHKTLKEKQNDS